jgi:hypothetical protein
LTENIIISYRQFILKSGGVLLDENTTITITCSPDFKRSVKSAIMDQGIDQFQEGYLKIFELGLKEFKKLKKEGKG